MQKKLKAKTAGEIAAATLDLAVQVIRRFKGDHCLGMAASLSYTSLLALVPIAAISFAILSVIPFFKDIRAEINDMVFNNFLPDTGEQVAEYFNIFVDNAGSMTTLGLAVLAVTAVMLLAAIESYINTIFRVTERRRPVPRILLLLAVLIVGPLLIGTSFSLATYILTLTRGLGIEAFTGPLGGLTRFTPALIVILGFTLFYVAVPNRTVRWADGLAGGLAAGLLFSAVRWGFSMYLLFFPTYRAIYGALSTIPVFLAWMFLSWAVILLGAQITAAIGERRENAASP
ncbi:MAG: YihY family inner membrane protein [Rhodospirillales bacterium]